MIAGGGTGGHIYPGIAIAKEIQKLDPQVEIHFVGTHGGLEEKIIAKEKYKLHLVSSGQLNLQGHFFKKIKTLFKIPLGFLKSIFLILRYQPIYVLGVGGYASGPFVLMASLLRKKCGIWEANAHPGMANRILSRFVSHCFLVFAEAKNYLAHPAAQVCGMPIRPEIEASAKELSEIEKVWSLDPLKILCFGGSQGARAINNAVSDFIMQNPDYKNRIELVHQTGSLDYARIIEKYQQSLIKVDVKEFIYNMPDYYKDADLLICRGGASTLAEASAFGVPPIVIPLPLADSHQQKNAEALVEKKSGLMILQKNLDANEIKRNIDFILQNTDVIKQMSRELKKNYISQGAHQIAKEILK